MARILIGKGTTNAQGIATMTEDATGEPITGYTGTGAGLINVEAEVTIDGSSFVSETYPVIDAISYDTGIYGSAVNQYYLNNTTYLSRTVETDGTGTTFDNSSTSSAYYAFLLKSDTTSPTSLNEACIYSNGDYVIECDIVSFTGNCEIGVRGVNGNVISRRFNQLSNNTSFHLKIVIQDGVGKYYIDGSDTATYTSNATDLGASLGVRLAIPNSQNVKIKNFKIYPI